MIEKQLAIKKQNRNSLYRKWLARKKLTTRAERIKKGISPPF